MFLFVWLCFPGTHCVPSLILRPYLICPPLIPYKDVEFPCLRPQTWFVVSLLHYRCTVRVLAISSHGYLHKSSVQGPLILIRGTLLNINFFSTVPLPHPCPPTWFYIQTLLSTLAQVYHWACPPISPSDKDYLVP